MATVDLPEPAGPATSNALPLTIPFPNISSSPAMPLDTYCKGCRVPCVSIGLTMRGKTLIPSLVIRIVCKPGCVSCPRIFTTWILRTIEFRFTFCDSHRMPSAIVKMA
jgi:hypothetical protein